MAIASHQGEADSESVLVIELTHVASRGALTASLFNVVPLVRIRRKGRRAGARRQWKHMSSLRPGSAAEGRGAIAGANFDVQGRHLHEHVAAPDMPGRLKTGPRISRRAVGVLRLVGSTDRRCVSL
jgi:hypothetical protein